MISSTIKCKSVRPWSTRRVRGETAVLHRAIVVWHRFSTGVLRGCGTGFQPVFLAVWRGAPVIMLMAVWSVALPIVAVGQQARPAAQAEPPDVHPLASKEGMIRDRFARFADRVYRLREQIALMEPENAARLDRVLQRAGELGLDDRLDDIAELLRDMSSLPRAMDVQNEWLADADRLLDILLERDSENAERDRQIQRLREYNEKVDELLDKQRELRDATGAAAMTRRMIAQLDQAIRRAQALLDRQQKLAEETQEQDTAAQRDRVKAQQRDLSADTEKLAEDLGRLGDLTPDPSADTQPLESAREKAKAAGESAKSGAADMSQAGESIGQGDKESAQSQQEQAAEALREAKAQLEAAKQQLESQSSTDEQAQEQQGLADQTGALSEKMKQDSSGGGEGKSGEGKSGPSPGQQSLDEAKGEMEDAGDSLKESKPDQAGPSQDRAIEDLEQAKKELEKALDQLRQEEREETLRDLESRFREMLGKQQAINEATVRLDETGREDFRRAEQLEAADLSARQRTLSDDAASCVHILDEEGTTIVFPRIVGQLSQDMLTVADRLRDFRVGALTRTIEAEIVDTLEQLLEAVQRMQEENEQQGGGDGGSSDSDSPLLPPSAELKLLRASQLRVNTRTSVVETGRTKHGDSDGSLSAALDSVARRQVECADMAREMRDRLDEQ